MDEARSENARLNEEVDFGRAIQELLTTENTELKTNCQERLEQAMQPLQQRIREYEEEHLNSEEIINNLLADHVLLQDNNRELTNEVDRLREELESVRDVQRLLEEENAELRRQPVSVSQSRVTHLQLESNQESWIIPESEVIIGDCETGRGSYGEIRVGTYHGAKVAVKKIHGILDDDQTRTEFEREILFNTLCRHPCIVQFAGVANPRGNNPLVIMELLDRSLRDLRNLDEKSFEVYQILQIAKDISAALCYLHSFKPDAIIHRDVSAGNILLWRSFGSMWRGKLADFGSATFDNDEKFACPGAPFYSAPEAAYPEQHSTKVGQN